MKKILILLLALIILSACSNSSKSSSEGSDQFNTDETNTEIKDVTDEDSSIWTISVEKQIKDFYGINNFKIDEDARVIKRFPDEINSESNEEYRHVINGSSDFTYQDKIYSVTFIYSMTDEDHYKTLYLYSNYDTTKEISVPLESDK